MIHFDVVAGFIYGVGIITTLWVLEDSFKNFMLSFFWPVLLIKFLVCKAIYKISHLEVHDNPHCHKSIEGCSCKINKDEDSPSSRQS